MNAMSEAAQSQWTSMCEAAKLLHETKDCAVKAVTAVTGVHYMDVHSLMAQNGRKHRKGTPNASTTLSAGTTARPRSTPACVKS